MRKNHSAAGEDQVELADDWYGARELFLLVRPSDTGSFRCFGIGIRSGAIGLGTAV